MKNKQTIKYYIVIAVIALISTIILIYLLYSKEAMNVDEYLTYALANYEGYMPVLDYGVKLPVAEFFDDYFYADGLNLKTVWVNQGNNVHPPLYYLFFHIFVLATHHFLALKTGALLNIIFHIINIYLIWRILREILHKEYAALLGTILYAFMPIILESVLFTRMYVLLSTFILGLTLLFVKEWAGENKKKFYIKLALISICGTLTHYYFLIYLFYCCLVWGIRLLKKRNWKEILTFLITMAVSGVFCLIFFPYTLQQVFAGNGGKRTYTSLLSLSAFWENGKIFLAAINNVFGGYLCVIVILVIVLFLFRYLFKENIKKEKNDIGSWAIIYVPCILYLITITKIAIMSGVRYISPLYGICIILLMGLFELLITYLTGREEIKCFVGILMIGIMINGGWHLYDWPYLYLDAKEYIEEAEDYGMDNECICIVTSFWRCLPSYHEFLKYQNITFVQSDHLEALYQEEYAGYDHVVVYMDKDLSQEESEEILQELINRNPGLDGYEELHRYSYNITYYLD